MVSKSKIKILLSGRFFLSDLTDVVCSPEGKYPLMLAIEKQQESIVRFLLKNGANPAARDPKGNNSVRIFLLF